MVCQIDKTLIKAPGILAGMEGLGTKIAGMGGPVKWLRKGFDPSYGKPADLAEDEIIRNIIRREGTQAAEEAAPKFGLKEDPTLVRGIEAWGKPEDLLAAEKGAGITAKAKAAEIRQQGEAAYKAKRQQLADMISERGLPEAEKAKFAAQAFAGSTIDQKIADILERPALKGLRDAEREAGTLVAEKNEEAWRRTVAMLDKADELEATLSLYKPKIMP